MAISRVPGQALLSDLDRQGIDLQFSTLGSTLAYLDFANFRFGINTATPNQELEVVGNILVTNGHVYASANITSDIGSVSNWFRNIYANTVNSTTLSGTLSTAAQPNITSVGTLSDLSVTGNVIAGSLATTGGLSLSGNTLVVDSISANTVAGTLTTGIQPYISNLANVTLTNLTATGNVGANWINASNANITNIYGALLTADQPYISNLGNITVTSISIGGNVSITGNANISVIDASEIYEAGYRVLTTNTSISITGDVTGSGSYSGINVSLTNTGVTADTYGNTTVVPTFVVDQQGRISSAANLVLTRVGNITVSNTRLITAGNLILSPGTNIIDVGNSRISNVAAPVVGSDVVTVSYLNSTLSGTANVLTDGNSEVRLTDTGVANLSVVLDGNLVSSITENNTTFVNTVNIGTLSLFGNTITNSTGNIRLDAQGAGIVQIVGADALGLPSGDSANRPGFPQVGYARFNTDAGSIEYWDGTDWIVPGFSTVTSETIYPDGIANTFVLSSNTTTYGVFVSINGTVQQPVSSYNIINNNQIIFTEIPVSTDIIEVRHFAAGVTITALQYGNSKIAAGAEDIVITGNIRPSANLVYNLGTADYQWKEIWVSGNTIYVGGSSISTEAGVLTFKSANGNTINLSETIDPSVLYAVGTLNTNIQAVSDFINVSVTGTEVASFSDSGLKIVGNILADGFNYSNGVSILEGVVNLVTSNAAVQAGLINDLTSNAAVQAGLISAAVTAAEQTTANANVAMKGYVDSQLSTTNSNVTTANTAMKGYVDSQISTVNSNITQANIGLKGYVDSQLSNFDSNANIAMKGYVDSQVSTLNSNITTANTAMKGYVDGQISSVTSAWQANAGIQAGNIATIFANLGSVSGSLATLTANAASQAGDIATLFANAAAQSGQIITANTAMKGYVDGEISAVNTAWQSNAAVQAGNIATIVANLGAVSGSIATLTANAGSQAGTITDLQNNFANRSGATFTGVVTVANTTQSIGSGTGALVVTGGVSVGANLYIGGNLFVAGTTTTVSTNNTTYTDGIIYLAPDNASDVIDLGFAASFTDPGYQHTGLVRDASDGIWKLFANVVPEPTSTVDFTNATYSTLKLGNVLADGFKYANGQSILTNVESALTTANTAMKGYVDTQISSVNSAWQANAGAQAGDIAALFANAGAQASSLSTLSGSIVTLTANAAVQAGLIATLTANAGAQAGEIVTANTAMKGYVDNQITTFNSNLTTANTAMKGYVDGQVSTLNSTITTANTAMKGYVDGQVSTLNSTITTANTAMKGYVDAKDATSNTAMKGYVDGQITSVTSAWQANAAVQAGNIATLFSNAAVQAGQIATLFANAATQAGLISTLADPSDIINNVAILQNEVSALWSNASVQAGLLADLEANAAAQSGQIVAANTAMKEYVDSIANNSSYSNANVGSYLTTYTGNIGNVKTTANIVTTQYFIGNGALLTGVVTNAGTTYSNANVAAYLTTYSGSLNSLTSVATSGTISATGQVRANAGIASSSTTTGALTVIGGVGISGALNVGGAVAATSLSGSITSSMVTTALGYTPYNSTNPSGYITGITSGMVTTALGYTPYNSSNPAGYITAVPNSSTRVSSLGVGTPASGVTGEIRATDNITAYYSSDARFKENVRDIPNALDKVTAIGGKLFDWTEEYIVAHGGLDDYFLTKESFGVIAQDVEQVFPEAVRVREDGYMAVDYERMCALAFQAIKELRQEIEILKQNTRGS